MIIILLLLILFAILAPAATRGLLRDICRIIAVTVLVLAFLFVFVAIMPPTSQPPTQTVATPTISTPFAYQIDRDPIKAPPPCEADPANHNWCAK